MKSYKLPCGTKNYYPEIIDTYTKKGKACVFHTVSPRNFVAYLIYPKTKGVEVIGEGTVSDMMHVYEALDLQEHTVSDQAGVFRFKLADTEDELADAMEEYISANAE